MNIDFGSMNKKLDQIINWAIIIIAIFFIGLVARKALISSFVHDESLAYNTYVIQSFRNIILSEPATANNHIFNTILMKLSGICFGPSEFALRLPNVLAFIGFLIFLILIMRKTGNRLLYLPFFIIIVANPYLLDFFALARGYGLGMYFMTGSLYFLMQFMSGEKRKDYLLALVFSSFAVWSNFVFLHFHFALILVSNLIFILESSSFLKYKKSELFVDLFRFNMISIITSAFLGIVIYEPVRKLFRYHQLYDGGANGFFSDTIASLSKGICYEISENKLVIGAIFIMIALFILISAFSFLWILFKERLASLRNKEVFVFSGILLFIIGQIQVGHYLFGMKYLHNRMGLFLIPLILLSSYYSFSFLIHRFKLKRIVFSFVFALAVITIFHFSYSIDIESYYEWRYDKNTKKMISNLKKDVIANTNGAPVSLGISWVFEPTINFYRQIDTLAWLMEVNRDGLNGSFQYIYILEDELGNLPFENDSIIIYFRDTHSFLIKNTY